MASLKIRSQSGFALLRKEAKLADADGFAKTNPTAGSSARRRCHWASLKIRSQRLWWALRNEARARGRGAARRRMAPPHKTRPAFPEAAIFSCQPLWPAGPSLRMKMDGPGHTAGVAGRVGILSFQTTGGRRFEHLAAKRDRRVHRRRRLESRLWQAEGLP